MDDETEKERLLKEIKFLTDLISNAQKPKETVRDVNSKPGSQSTPLAVGESNQQKLHHRRHEGSNTFNCTNPVPLYPRHNIHLQGGKISCALDPLSAQVNRTSLTKKLSVPLRSDFTESSDVQKAASLKFTRTLNASIPKPKTETLNTDSLSGMHSVPASKSDVPLSSERGAVSIGTGSSGQKGQVLDKTSMQNKHPSLRLDRQRNVSAGVIDAKVSNSTRSLVSAKAQLLQWQRNQLIPPERGLQEQKVAVLKLNSSCSGVKIKEPVHAVSVLARAHSTHKEQLVLKTAEVMSKLTALKSSLTKLAAAKKRKTVRSTLAPKSASSEAKLQSETCNTRSKHSNQTFATGKVKEENAVTTSKVKEENAVTTKASDKRTSVTASGCHQRISKRSSDVKMERSASSPNFTLLKPVAEKSHSLKAYHMVKKLVNSSPDRQCQTLESTHPLPVFSTISEPPTCTPPIVAERESGVFLTEKDKTHCSSPSKSFARANLERELKATEEKLVTMRKKMGVMLKESPKKTSEYINRTAVPSQYSKTDLVSLSVKAAMHGCAAKGDSVAANQSLTPGSPSTVGATAELRPLPNRKSLRWTPQKAPLQKLSERVLVVGSSPSLRSFHNTSCKSALNLFEARKNNSIHAHTTNRNALSVKKSRYSLVKNPGHAAISKTRESTSQAAASPASKQLRSQAVKTFVGRYKLQRLNSDAPKTSKSGRNLQGRVMMKSRYKLMKLHSSQPYSVGCSAPQTAMVRAAKVIKTKYKMRKVPVNTPPFNSAASLGQKEYSVTPHTSVRYLQGGQPYVWKMKASRPYNRLSYSSTSASRYSFQSSSSFLPNAASRNPFRGRQRRGRNSAAYFTGGSWSQREAPYTYSSSKWWWTQQHQGKYSLHQQSLRHRAKTVTAWKAQQRAHLHLTQYPYTGWPAKGYPVNRDQQQKRLLLKRLQWMRKYHLSRKQTSSQDSPRKSRPQDQRQEHLVMINGILYKSSTSRLTKAYSSSSSLSHPSKPGSTAVAAMSSASLSQSKLNSSVIVRNVKQRRMQMVTVRGVSFRVDSRGTKLQRVQSSVSHPDKPAAISRVDVGGTTYVQTKDGVLEKISDSQTRSVVNRVKQRSIALAAAKFKKDNTKSKKKNCLFFSRFGKCSRGLKCPFLHDPEKIAVCTRFLRGTCKVENCPFSHKVSKEKMPVCAFFLRGVCTREDCPYLHVKVSHGAEVCQDFVSGFCSLADKCPKLHTLTCPQFAKTGVCPDGRKCRMLHRKVKAAGKHRAKLSASSVAVDNSGSRVAQQGTKRPAEHDDTPDHRASLPRLKRFRRDRHTDPPQGDDPPKQKPAESGATPDPEGSVPSQSTTTLREATDSVELGGECKDSPPQKPAKLPAFISLADYSLEESPLLRAPVAKSLKRSLLEKGISLQIKPRL